MTTHLLDADVVIAASVVEHVHYRRVEAWLLTRPGTLAVCPVVEGALMRYLVRAGPSAADALSLLRSLRQARGLEFWADDLSYRDADLSHVRGHRQVTNAYLVALATARGGVLATLDAGLVRAHPDSAVLVPELPAG